MADVAIDETRAPVTAQRQRVYAFAVYLSSNLGHVALLACIKLPRDLGEPRISTLPRDGDTRSFAALRHPGYRGYVTGTLQEWRAMVLLSIHGLPA